MARVVDSGEIKQRGAITRGWNLTIVSVANSDEMKEGDEIKRGVEFNNGRRS
jgi:hypothetical protein